MRTKEEWKDITGYENLYQISNLGRVKRLPRNKRSRWGTEYTTKEAIATATIGTYGYLIIGLTKDGKTKTHKVHQLVAINFLNHTPSGMKLVVNHINHIKTDNRVTNLEIITTRENTNKKQIKSTSEYTGVSWKKDNKKWLAQIMINKRINYIGLFDDEYEAHLAYQEILNSI